MMAAVGCATPARSVPPAIDPANPQAEEGPPLIALTPLVTPGPDVLTAPNAEEAMGSAHAGHDMGSAAHADMKGHDMGHAKHAGGMIGVHSKAAASDVDGGAKLSFVAGGNDVAKLQSELRMHAQHMSNGTCTMGKS